MPREKTPEINAGSMADIAFLLLVFFLVTTTISTDTGVNTILPPYIPPMTNPPEVERQNLYSIKINSQNQLLLNGTEGQYTQIKANVIEFLTNYGKRSDYSENPRVAIVSIQNDNGTDFDTYLTVYNEVKAGYNAVWEAYAQKQFGRNMANLTQVEVDSVKAEFPQLLSEAEPTDFGKEVTPTE